MHLRAGLTAAPWIMEPFAEIGANFSLQLSSRTQFAKIRNKKVIAENQCKNIKTRVFLFSFFILQNSPVVGGPIKSIDLHTSHNDVTYFQGNVNWSPFHSLSAY